MSGLRPRADIGPPVRDVRYGPLGDISQRPPFSNQSFMIKPPLTCRVCPVM